MDNMFNSIIEEKAKRKKRHYVESTETNNNVVEVKKVTPSVLSYWLQKTYMVAVTMLLLVATYKPAWVRPQVIMERDAMVGLVYDDPAKLPMYIGKATNQHWIDLTHGAIVLNRTKMIASIKSNLDTINVEEVSNLITQHEINLEQKAIEKTEVNRRVKLSYKFQRENKMGKAIMHDNLSAFQESLQIGMFDGTVYEPSQWNHPQYTINLMMKMNSIKILKWVTKHDDFEKAFKPETIKLVRNRMRQYAKKN